VVEIVDAIRATVPETVPLFVRVSATDWVEGGLELAEVAELARVLAGHGVDLIDVSSAGNDPRQKIELSPGYQVPFARSIRAHSGLPVAAVGLITEPRQAEKILEEESADAVLLGRVLLREPTWPQRAALELGADLAWPVQYERGRQA
jgi:2,4-dienoyl-CoA reductase-like NADH-dependent reductase (Old Yellow Enzyme family)